MRPFNCLLVRPLVRRLFRSQKSFDGLFHIAGGRFIETEEFIDDEPLFVDDDDLWDRADAIGDLQIFIGNSHRVTDFLLTNEFL